MITEKRVLTNRKTAFLDGANRERWVCLADLALEDGVPDESFCLFRYYVAVIEMSSWTEAKVVAQGILDTIAELEARA